MSPKPRGDRPLTVAERQALYRARKVARAEALTNALRRVQKAKTLPEAIEIATAAIRPPQPER